MDPMLQINNVFSLVMQQERKLQYGSTSSSVIVIKDNLGLVNAVDGQRQFAKGKGSRSVVCSH